MKKATNVATAKRNIAISAFWIIIAFFLFLSSVHTNSFSWLFNKKTADILSENYLKIHADEGLRMGYGDIKFLTDPISINNFCPYLTECTSVDGRNIFFPISEFTKQNYGSGTLVGDGELSENANTQDFLFRKANANDKNTKYLSVDFTLSSDKDDTKVWISNESTISGSAMNAVRFSIDMNDGTQPIVFNSAQSGEVSVENVVELINNDGTIASTDRQISKAMSNHFYTNDDDERHLLTVDAGEVLNLTMTVWLEGADANCVDGIYLSNDLKIDLIFSTGLDNARTIYFIDDTYNSWIGNDGNEMYVKDLDTSYTYKMTKSDDKTWQCNLPETTATVVFIRKSSENDANAMTWEAGSVGKDKAKPAYQYHALGEGVKGGLWMDSFTSKTIAFQDGNAAQWIRKNDAEIFVSYEVPDSNNGNITIGYFAKYYGKPTTVNGYDTYLMNILSNSIAKFKFERYVNGVSDARSWSANKTLTDYNLYKSTSAENLTIRIGSWSTNAALNELLGV